MAPDRGLTDVLVVGAGPTGLATALQVCSQGGTVRIVERRPAAPRPSRAMILHPRTLEVLRPLGVTDALLDRADTRPRAELHVGRRVLDVRMDHLMLPDSAFPHLTLIRQMDVEAVLSRAIEARGVVVERGTELTGLALPVGAGRSGWSGRSGRPDPPERRGLTGGPEGNPSSRRCCARHPAQSRRSAGSSSAATGRRAPRASRSGSDGAARHTARRSSSRTSTLTPPLPQACSTPSRAAMAWSSCSRSARAPPGGCSPPEPRNRVQPPSASRGIRCLGSRCRRSSTRPDCRRRSPDWRGRRGFRSSTGSPTRSGPDAYSSPATLRTHTPPPAGRG